MKQSEIWPNFFIVGAVKSGTTSLYAYLSQHPQVYMPRVKEPHFFTQATPAPEQRYLVEVINDKKQYLALYRHASGYKARGDASPSYLWSADAARRISRTIPDARIIILLRDPIERAHAHYLMDFAEGVQDADFYRALIKDWTRKDKGWGVSQLYVELGLYAEQVKRYLDLFGPDRVKVVMFDALCRSPGKVVQEIAAFLELDLALLSKINTNDVYNGYIAPRGHWARALAGNRYIRYLGRQVLPQWFGEFVWRNFMLKRDAQKPPIDPRAVEFLAPIYSENLKKLEAVMGRPLPDLWRTLRKFEISSSALPRKKMRATANS